jgi:hypothetical protein
LAYIYTGRYADAVRESRRALALSPGYKEAYRCLEGGIGSAATRLPRARRGGCTARRDPIDPDRDPYDAVDKHEEQVLRQLVAGRRGCYLLVEDLFGDAALVCLHLDRDRFRCVSVRGEDVDAAAVP